MATQNKEVVQTTKKTAKKKDIQYYREGVLVNRSHLVLKKEEDIESYVKTVLNKYFRTTNKANITLESKLIDHGLDSLDSMEISMMIEEELGYHISAETLPVLQKVKHFVNYIKHVEQFKHDLQRDPLA